MNLMFVFFGGVGVMIGVWFRLIVLSLVLFVSVIMICGLLILIGRLGCEMCNLFVEMIVLFFSIMKGLRLILKLLVVWVRLWILL